MIAYGFNTVDDLRAVAARLLLSSNYGRDSMKHYKVHFTFYKPDSIIVKAATKHFEINATEHIMVKESELADALVALQAKGYSIASVESY